MLGRPQPKAQPATAGKPLLKLKNHFSEEDVSVRKHFTNRRNAHGPAAKSQQ